MTSPVLKAATIPMIPKLSPNEVHERGMRRYENNVLSRLLNAAFHASLNATGKTNFRPRHVVVRIVGPAGVGKTAIVESYARQEGLHYVKLDTQVTDIAEVFGLKSVENGETIQALPSWWPQENTLGVLNLDDMSRALPHVLQSLQQFILEREFNGAKLPDGWMIVITDNPSEGEYNVSSLDPAQLTRMISVPWNPPAALEYEQLMVQEVDADMQSFWTANPELLRHPIVTLDRPPANSRLRMIFNRIYPFIKDDAELLDFVGNSMFGPNFVTLLKSYMSSEKPILLQEIFSMQSYQDRLTRWEETGRQDLISLSIERFLQELRFMLNNDQVITQNQFALLSKFLQVVSIDAGAVMVQAFADTSQTFGQKMAFFLVQDKALMDRYHNYVKSILNKLD